MKNPLDIHRTQSILNAALPPTRFYQPQHELHSVVEALAPRLRSALLMTTPQCM